MSMFNQFIKSSSSPKHIALFRFQGIGKTIGYLFFLSLIMSIPAFWAAAAYVIAGTDATRNAIEELMPLLSIAQGQSQNEVILVAAGLFFYYVLISFTLFFKATVFGGFALIAVSLLKKRAEYRHLFRMAAYSLTLPALLTTLIQLTGLTFSFAYLIDWLLIAFILILSIRFLPGAPK